MQDFAQSPYNSHYTEMAHPGYYAVTLANGTRVELTVGERAGIARFEFPRGMKAALLAKTGASANTVIHMRGHVPVGREHDGSRVRLVGDEELTGTVTSGGFCGSPTRFTLYAAARFEQPYQRFDTWHCSDAQYRFAQTVRPFSD